MSSLPYFFCYNCHMGLSLNPTSPAAYSFCCPFCFQDPRPPPPPTLHDNNTSPWVADDEDDTSLFTDSETDYSDYQDEDPIYTDSENDDPMHDDPIYNSEEDDINTASLLSSLPGVKQFPNTNSDDSKCPICMEEYGTKMVVELPCKHCFDNNCIVEWIKRSDTCPMCRFKLPFDEHKLELARRNDMMGLEGIYGDAGDDMYFVDMLDSFVLNFVPYLSFRPPD